MAQPNPNSSRIDRRFDVLRSKVEQDANAQQQRANEGLQRKAAAQGMQGSGTFIKLQNQQGAELNKAKQNALMDVEAQREGAQAQADEIQAQRDFAKAEREASQGFMAQQADLARQFESGEQDKNRAFQSSEAAVARGFSKQLFDKEMKFKKKVQKDANSQFKSQMDLAKKQFKLDEKVSKFNMEMAQAQFNQKDLLESAQNVFGYDPRTGKNTRGGIGSLFGGFGGRAGGGGGGGGLLGGGGGGLI